MHTFQPLLSISGIGVFAMALPASMACVAEPVRANRSQGKLNDGHSATRIVQHACARLAGGG